MEITRVWRHSTDKDQWLHFALQDSQGIEHRLAVREDGHVQTGHGQNLYRVLEQSHELREGE
jgi:hypothetical protein